LKSNYSVQDHVSFNFEWVCNLEESFMNRRAFIAACSVPLASTALAAGPFDCLDEKTRAAVERNQMDWAQLSRYRGDNEALRSSKARVDVVFMGDSITEGWVAKAPDLFKSGRVGRGISGQTTPQMLVRFREDVVDLKPHVVHIMAGTNDVAGNTGPMTPEMTQANLLSMVDLARANKIKVVLASIPPADHFFWRPESKPNPGIPNLNAWIKEYARNNKIPYADYFAAMANEQGVMKPGLANDGVHPTQEGYAVMNPIAERAIAQAM
jgi:lysophospholipase L1-like esterase